MTYEITFSYCSASASIYEILSGKTEAIFKQNIFL
jgi:hypothetical protein